MSAIKQVTEEKIVSVATEIVRREGMSALNARAVAKKLGCSTRPIYLAFAGMEELKKAVTERITRIYQDYLRRETESGKYPLYKCYGMGYIRFAREEKQLFGYLFMRNRTAETQGIDGGDVTPVIEEVMRSTGLDRRMAERFHWEVWVFVHGIASVLATSYADFDEKTVDEMLSDMFIGLKQRFLSISGE